MDTQTIRSMLGTASMMLTATLSTDAEKWSQESSQKTTTAKVTRTTILGLLARLRTKGSPTIGGHLTTAVTLQAPKLPVLQSRAT